MKVKKYLLYFFLSIASLTVGYFLYIKWFSNNHRTLWDLVPENALIVYETNGIALIWNDLIQTKQWENLRKIPAVASREFVVEKLDSLAGRQGKLDQISRNDKVLISIHQISNTELDAIFYISLLEENAQKLLREVLDTLSGNDDFEIIERYYQENLIREIKKKSVSRSIFTFSIIDNIFVASFTPFLLEDVVRNISANNNFSNGNENLFSISSLSNDKGNLYINFPAATGYVKNFFSKDNPFSSSLNNLLSNGFLDITFDDRNFFLNGFSFLQKETSLLSTLAEATPGESKVKTLIPSQTAMLYQLNVGDGNSWMTGLETFWNNSKSLAGDWENLQKDYGFQTDRFFSLVTGEIALCLLESLIKQKSELILFIHTSDINGAYNQINTLAERANKIIGDTLYTETFSDYKITQLNIKQFPQKVLGKQFIGFNEVYYMPVLDYIVFSNSVENLKSLIIDIESENTWGKRVSQTSFLENTLEKFNAGLIIDIPKAFDLLHNVSSPQLKNFLEKNSRVIKSFEKASIQFRNQGTMLYTSIAIRNGGSIDSKPEVDFEPVQSVAISSEIISKPFVVRNYINGSLEVLVQDTARFLYLINNQGEVLWKDSLGFNLRGEVEQIDFFKNDKLQYLVCLGDHFRLIDRNGNEITDFTLKLPFQVFNWKVIDYDRSKNYRILISDFQGNLFLYDKNGENLEGWTPKLLSGRLGSVPFHLRVRGRDVIIGIQENGIVNMMTRRGENLRGFPLDLKGRTNNTLFIEKGGDFQSSLVTALTNEGELIKFDLEGKILDRDQLFKPNPTTTFAMVVERLGRTFVIMQQDGSRLSMLDKNGVLLFEKDYLSTTALSGQYYDFGSGKKIYIVIDPIQEFAYIYLENGVLVNSRPLASGNLVGLLYFEGLQKFHVYSTFMNNFQISGFYVQ